MSTKVSPFSLPGEDRPLAPPSVTPLMPIYASIIKFCAVCFWIHDNQRYSKARYTSTRTKSMLYCGLSHVQL